MTTTSTKSAREAGPAKAASRPEPRREQTRRIGREVGTLAVNVYERGVADVVAFEKDVAKIAPYPWAVNKAMRSPMRWSASAGCRKLPAVLTVYSLRRPTRSRCR